MSHVLCYCKEQGYFHIESISEHIAINVRRLSTKEPIPHYHVMFIGTKNECKDNKNSIEIILRGIDEMV